MNALKLLPVVMSVALLGACNEMPRKDSTQYGEASSSGTTSSTRNERQGTLVAIEDMEVDANYKLGVGTAVGAVAGGLLGSAVGDSKTSVAVGAVLGGLAGTYGESKVKNKTVQRVTVNMSTGGRLTVVQPVDNRLRTGMHVHVQGSGENARVVPQ